MKKIMKEILNKIKVTPFFISFAGMLIFSTCVTDRPARTGIYSENIYLDKQFLTRENPNNPGKNDFGWLYNITVTAVSTPNVLADAGLFPGESKWPTLDYVRFVFKPESMQLVDGIELMEGNFPDVVGRVISEWPGEHVDLQLRQNLDGEKTNYLEENKERPWENRQHFKIKITDAKLEDVHTLSIYDHYFVSQCAQLKAVSYVPGSFEYVDTVAGKSNMCPEDASEDVCRVDWEKGDYMSWTIEATYQIDPVGPCAVDLMQWATDVFTTTVDLKYSFWRPPAPPEGMEYVPRDIKEKDKWRKKFGIFEALQVYTDPDTSLTGAIFKMARFNPKRPIVYYFSEGFPDKYKDAFRQIADDTNALFEMAGVDARVSFHEHDENNIPRRFGDVRYSFVDLHRNQYTTQGLLGMGPPHIDPRTGEVVNGTVNLYDFGFQYYTFLMKDFLEQVSDAFDDLNEGGNPLPTPCTPGETRPVIDEKVQQELQNTTLYNKMVQYMGEPPEQWVPSHPQWWYDYYHMLLPDFRFAVPWWNTFVYDRDGTQIQKYNEMKSLDMDFRRELDLINHGENPVGINDATTPGYIEAAIDHINLMKKGMANAMALEAQKMIRMGQMWMDPVDGPSLLESIPRGSRMCKEDGTWETYKEWEDRIITAIVHQGGIHEFGHNLGLRHNFYGSVDEKNSPENAPGNSVMDYISHMAEAGAPHTWWNQDKASLVYAYRYNSQEEVDKETDKDIYVLLNPEDPEMTGKVTNPERQYLFCTDEHSYFSPFCRTFDLGVTPTEIVKDVITRYDWLYRIRNFRSYRQFWDTSSYPNQVLSYIFPLRRFLEMWVLDWDSASLESDLRLMGVEGDQYFFANVADEFSKEMGQANRLAVNFMQAILQQSTGERSYATTYDSFYGDVTRQGIIYDKYFAMLTFIGLWPVDSYNQDYYAYLAYYEYDWGNAQLYSDSLNILDSMLGGQYDVYPWFLPLAVLVFAQDTHDINFGDQSKKEWIGFRKFDEVSKMIEYFGFDPRDEALGPLDDGHQIFHDQGGNKWIYVFLPDRNVHLCVPYDKSPASFKLLWDYNEAVNIDRADYVVTYEIKYWLDFYEYFN